MNNRTGRLKDVQALALLLSLALITACSALGGATATATPGVGLANPASVNCEEQGGTSTVETRPDGGEFGVCLFEDNMQCEEFALLRGDCPVGGVRVTGYVTDAGRYCAISGGTYAATGETTSDGQEAGTCTFNDGSTCDVFAFYDGTCSAGSSSSETEPSPGQVNCEEQGGTHTVETLSNGTEINVCLFEDNRQCEEVALFSGACPVGGVRVTGFVTEAGRYCAITGGTYTATGETTDSGEEAGTCTLSDGTVCDVFAYYDGTCSIGSASAGEEPSPGQVNCEEQGGTHTVETLGDGSEVSVCLFEDNRQCTEVALFSGACPAGGIHVAGYATDAARHCAISGGTYTATGGTTDTDEEAGTCTFSDGLVCDVFAYYNNTCAP